MSMRPSSRLRSGRSGTSGRDIQFLPKLAWGGGPCAARWTGRCEAAEASNRSASPLHHGLRPRSPSPRKAWGGFWPLNPPCAKRGEGDRSRSGWWRGKAERLRHRRRVWIDRSKVRSTIVIPAEAGIHSRSACRTARHGLDAAPGHPRCVRWILTFVRMTAGRPAVRHRWHRQGKDRRHPSAAPPPCCAWSLPISMGRIQQVTRTVAAAPACGSRPWRPRRLCPSRCAGRG